MTSLSISVLVIFFHRQVDANDKKTRHAYDRTDLRQTRYGPGSSGAATARVVDLRTPTKI